jgi:hypothetical protein
MNAKNVPSRIMLVVTTLVTTLQSCTKNNDEKPDPLPVVEGYLAPGQPPAVSITREVLYGGSGTVTPIAGLTVQITHSGQQYTLAEVSPGRYQSSSLPVIAGETYRLSFSYNGREVTATTEVPFSLAPVTATASEMVVPQIGAGIQIPDPILFSWQNPNEGYCLMVVRNMEANPRPITFNLGDNVIEKPAPLFRMPPIKGHQQQLSLGRFSYYGRHAVIVYRIQPEYAALYEDNSNNSTNLEAPSTNIENGLGIFTGVHAADTLWVQVR